MDVFSQRDKNLTHQLMSQSMALGAYEDLERLFPALATFLVLTQLQLQPRQEF
jgi:hypothetical protein